MSKKITLAVLFFVFFLGFKIACAEVLINEIKYSPTTSQWIEIYNNTDSDVDITTYKILDNSVKTGHSISAYNNGSNLIPKNSFGIIAKVPEDFSANNFPIFKSALNIKVSADNVVLKNNLGENVGATVIIDGSATDGNSLQLINNEWKVSLPTPGLINKISIIVTPNTPSGGGPILTSSPDISTTTSSNNNDNVANSLSSFSTSTIKTKISVPTLAYARLPIKFQASTTGLYGETLHLGKYFWNFGDGDFKEQVNQFGNFTHTYAYPGDYVILLEYYQNPYSEIPDTVNKTNIKIIPLDISISKVGDEKDFFIELSNNSPYEIDVSGWILSNGIKQFVLPKNTIILSQKGITLAPKITNFVSGDEKNLKLISPTGEIISDYGVSILPYVAPEVSQAPVSSIIPTIENNSEKKLDTENIKVQKQAGTLPKIQIQNKNLEAVAINSQIIPETSSKNYYFPYIIFGFFLVASGFGVYFIRRKNILPQTEKGDDFEILDE